MKHFFLGLATDFSRKERLLHTFSHASKKDIVKLEEFLSKKYDGAAIATKNGRSALAIALKTLLPRGAKVLVNGFTCYAVVEAVKGAGMEPVFVDISREDLNFKISELRKKAENGVAGIIVQNTMGNMVNISEVEKIAKSHNLTIIEDLAHSAGRKYPDGREAGTIGTATVLSFGKDKVASAISGGAVIFRDEEAQKTVGKIRVGRKKAKYSDNLRIRLYPLFGAISRGLTCVKLGGIFMKVLVKLHLVEKSADNRLDLTQRIAPLAAKTALMRLKNIKDEPIRSFYLVNNRDRVLKELKQSGYYFAGVWYEKPVGPERYYKNVHFPEEECKEAVFVAEHIINFPNYYSKNELERANKIVQRNVIEEAKNEN